MNQTYNLLDNPLAEGIKIIGIGKHGSKPLPDELLHDILAYLHNEEVVPIQKGAFFGALMAKGPTEKELALLNAIVGKESFDTTLLYERLCTDSPAEMKAIGIKLLNKEQLTKSEAEQLGDYLFSDLPGETFRGMAASMLRIRYETEEEYHGLMLASEKTYTGGFKERLPAAPQSIQLAEPFDGVEHSYMITPLLAQALQKAGYGVVVSMGRSSGPKLQLNTLDLYNGLEAQFIRNNREFRQRSPAFGWALDQELLSPALDQWVERRKLLKKRPFLATLEKVLNPCNARILITSVFHITYMEKMIRLAEMAGFAGVIVLKRGLEGTLAPSLAKASGILCAARQADGSFLTQSFEANHEAFAPFRAEKDENIDDLQVEDNLRLIREYAAQGYTGNGDFDKRVRLAFSLYQTGLKWIQNHLSS